MTDYVIPEPEPKEIDEKVFQELSILAGNAVLRGHPYGDERCRNCRYYLDTDADLSYCWHQKLRILVGGEWWCQWWDAAPGGGPNPSASPSVNDSSTPTEGKDPA